MMYISHINECISNYIYIYICVCVCVCVCVCLYEMCFDKWFHAIRVSESGSPSGRARGRDKWAICIYHIEERK